MNQNHQNTYQISNQYTYTSNNINKPPKTYSWPVVILVLILFFPVGFYFLYKRLTADKSNIYKGVKIMRIFAYLFWGISVFYLLGGLTGQTANSDGTVVSASDALYDAVILSIPGFICFFLIAPSLKRKANKYSKYLALLIDDPVYEIEEIANKIGVPYFTALADLQKMVKEGYLFGAVVDPASRTLTFMNRIDTTTDHVVDTAAPKQARKRTVSCKNCGASNTVDEDSQALCEYCGTVL